MKSHPQRVVIDHAIVRPYKPEDAGKKQAVLFCIWSANLDREVYVGMGTCLGVFHRAWGRSVGNAMIKAVLEAHREAQNHH